WPASHPCESTRFDAAPRVRLRDPWRFARIASSPSALEEVDRGAPRQGPRAQAWAFQNVETERRAESPTPSSAHRVRRTRALFSQGFQASGVRCAASGKGEA